MVFILRVTSEFAKSESQYPHGVRFEVSGTAGNLVRYCIWNAVPAKSKGYSAWLKSISYSISYSFFWGKSFFYSILTGKIVLLLDFFYSFTEKCNRSFTPFYRSPTLYFTHPFDGGLGQGLTCAHFADSACMNLPSHKIMEFLEISTR